MSEGETEKPIETITLRAAVDRYGDPAALAQLALLGKEVGEERVDRVLSGRKTSHFETRAVRSLGFDVDAIRATLVEPILALLASGKLICEGYDATQPLNRKKVRVPPGRIMEFAFDFAASEASCDDTRLTRVVVGKAKGKTSPVPIAKPIFERWYKERAARLEEKGETSNFERDMGDARDKFSDRVTYRMIKDIRRKTGPDAWKKRGPKTE